jgi:hypothetical protein
LLELALRKRIKKSGYKEKKKNSGGKKKRG